jgi:hypothetical protein
MYMTPARAWAALKAARASGVKGFNISEGAEKPSGSMPPARSCAIGTQRTSTRTSRYVQIGTYINQQSRVRRVAGDNGTVRLK